MRQILCKQSFAPQQPTVKFWYLSGQEGLFKRAAVASTGAEGGEALLCSFCRLLVLPSWLDLSESAAFSGKTACAPRELTPAPQVPFPPLLQLQFPTCPVVVQLTALVLEDLWLPTDMWEVHVLEAEPGQIPTYRAEVPP